MVDVEDYIAQGTKTSLWTAFRKIRSDNNLLGNEILKLENDLGYNATRHSIEKRAKAIGDFIDKLNNDFKELKKAKSDFLNRKMIEELDEKRGMSSLFG